MSLKTLDPGKIEEASHGSARQKVALKAGISQEVGKQINKLVKDMGVKSLSSSIQGDQVRVTGKQRDDLQRAIAPSRRPTSTCPCSSRTSATRCGPLLDGQVLVDLLDAVDVEDPVEDEQLQHPEDAEAEQVGARRRGRC